MNFFFFLLSFFFFLLHPFLRLDAEPTIVAPFYETKLLFPFESNFQTEIAQSEKVFPDRPLLHLINIFSTLFASARSNRILQVR